MSFCTLVLGAIRYFLSKVIKGRSKDTCLESNMSYSDVGKFDGWKLQVT